MVRQSGCTLSNIAIDYLENNDFNVLIEFNNEVFMYRWTADIWIAEKNGKRFSAVDPLRLLGLVTIIREYGESWGSVEVASASRRK